MDDLERVSRIVLLVLGEETNILFQQQKEHHKHLVSKQRKVEKRLADNCQILAVRSDICKIGQLSDRTTVSADNCQIGQLSDRTTVRSDNCQIGQLSVGTTVSGDNCQWDNCQWTMDNCQRKLSVL